LTTDGRKKKTVVDWVCEISGGKTFRRGETRFRKAKSLNINGRSALGRGGFDERNSTNDKIKKKKVLKP